MPNRHYANGANAERELVATLKDLGWEAARCAGSKGAYDVFAARDGEVQLFQVKRFGGGKRATTYRCVGCGKRDQFRNAHDCSEGTEWRRELIDPHAAPPTMLAFQEWSRTWALEVYRVLKPGGHLLTFGGTRTYHRVACAIEEAGFELRDSIMWMYGSGFPKSLNVGNAIDKAQGAEPAVVGSKVGQPGYSLAEGPDNSVLGKGIGGSGDPERGGWVIGRTVAEW